MGYMFCLCNLYLFTGIQHDSSIRWCLCCLTVTRRVKQELLSLPEHLSSSLVLMGVRVARSLVFGLVDCCLSFFIWSLCCCLSSSYGFCLHLWYLQTIRWLLTSCLTATTLSRAVIPTSNVLDPSSWSETSNGGNEFALSFSLVVTKSWKNW